MRFHTQLVIKDLALWPHDGDRYQVLVEAKKIPDAQIEPLPSFHIDNALTQVYEFVGTQVLRQQSKLFDRHCATDSEIQKLLHPKEQGPKRGGREYLEILLLGARLRYPFEPYDAVAAAFIWRCG